MDCSTKWPEAYGIPNQEASTVAEAYRHTGIPCNLHSDQKVVTEKKEKKRSNRMKLNGNIRKKER
jgi:hypothetical protein